MLATGMWNCRRINILYMIIQDLEQSGMLMKYDGTTWLINIDHILWILWDLDRFSILEVHARLWLEHPNRNVHTLHPPRMAPLLNPGGFSSEAWHGLAPRHRSCTGRVGVLLRIPQNHPRIRMIFLSFDCFASWKSVKEKIIPKIHLMISCRIQSFLLQKLIKKWLEVLLGLHRNLAVEQALCYADALQQAKKSWFWHGNLWKSWPNQTGINLGVTSRP